MSLMEQFANPETFDALSMGDRLVGATVTMCMGLGITFSILCILWIFIVIMGKVTNRPAKEKAPAPAPAPAAAAPAAAPAPAVEAAAPAEADNAELVAVIAAAIAAMEGKPVCDLVVRSITRVPGSTTSWSSAGIRDCIASRR